jgi:Xaa-Pro aminopeptidase
VATEHRFGGQQSVGFETVTMAPLQLKMVEASLLTAVEVAWVNAYQAEVLAKLAPLIDDGEDGGRASSWLARDCSNTQFFMR